MVVPKQACVIRMCTKLYIYNRCVCVNVMPILFYTGNVIEENISVESH